MASSDQFNVIKSEGTFVVPSVPTPTHTLPLSWIDKLPINSMQMDLLFVFKEGQCPADIIKDALAKALVPYYPVAGRIVRSEQGEVTGVDCTGGGVWFVGASMDYTIEDVMGWLENLPPSKLPRDQLLPSLPNPESLPIMLQVTRFKCGGFVVGLKLNHVMVDGIGISQIMNAIGDIARGNEQPMVAPVWLREQFPNPTNPWPPIPLPQPGSAMSLEQLIVDVPQDYINRVKALFMKKTGKRCSTFDVTIAHLWQCWIRAIGPYPNVRRVLYIPIDTRGQFSDLLPEKGGYYGNCIFPMLVEAPSGKIAETSIVEVVDLIKDAKKRFLNDFRKPAMVDSCEKAATMADYDCMIVSDWIRLGLTEVDYGWGRPVYVAPAPDPNVPGHLPFCNTIKPPLPKTGLRLITKCVRKEHLETFSDQMFNFSTQMTRGVSKI